MITIMLETGMNACYIEELDHIPTTIFMEIMQIINTVWGAFSAGLALLESRCHLPGSLKFLISKRGEREIWSSVHMFDQLLELKETYDHLE